MQGATPLERGFEQDSIGQLTRAVLDNLFAASVGPRFAVLGFVVVQGVARSELVAIAEAVVALGV
jgi:hypothetical protein